MVKPNILLLEYSQRFNHYKPLMDAFDANYIVDEYISEREFRKLKLDLTLCSDECVPSTFRDIMLSKKYAVPVLHIPDGVLEWRNTYEHPRAFSMKSGMPLHQPHFADKIACIGRNQARMMEAWGSRGQCEVVGCARFDEYAGLVKNIENGNGPFKILVTTAKTPGFSSEQQAKIEQSFQDLYGFMDGVGYEVRGRTVELHCRFFDDRYKPDAKTSFYDRSVCPLSEVLADIDAVITTPSTVILEAMFFRVPVVKIDYTNSPEFMQCVWNITAPQHIENIVNDLIDFPYSKTLHQDIILHDCLECMTPAVDRLVFLVKEMIRIGSECREKGGKLNFPYRIVPIDPHVDSNVEEVFDLKSLYPGHPVFSRMDLVQLQVENGQLNLLVEDFYKLKNSLPWRIAWPLRKFFRHLYCK